MVGLSTNGGHDQACGMPFSNTGLRSTTVLLLKKLLISFGTMIAPSKATVLFLQKSIFYFALYLTTEDIYNRLIIRIFSMYS
jgi:uncharacterized membrane protein YGL010W